MRPHAHDQVAALQAHVDQLKKEKDRLMDDKEEAMELVEWAERKLQEATERIEQLEMQLSALQAGREQAVQAPPGLDGAFKRALGTMKAAQQRHLDSSKAASAAAQVLHVGRRWRRRRGPHLCCAAGLLQAARALIIKDRHDFPAYAR